MSTTESEATPKGKAKVEVINVQMDDGTTLAFSGKRKMLKEAVFDSDGNWIGSKFSFRNGRIVNHTAPAADFKLKDGRYALQAYAAHGDLQKVGDETAGEDKVDDMVLAVEDIIEQLDRGEWSVEREGGGMSGTSVLIKALVESSGKAVESIKAFLKGKTKQQKDAMRNSDRLRPIVQRLEAEEAAKAAHVDTGALFGELDSAA